MAGLVPAIHVLPLGALGKSWMPGTSPGMTESHSTAGTRSRVGRASFFTALDATMVRLPA
jgi:hypothetical protein